VSAISGRLGFSASTLANVERHIEIAYELGAIQELTEVAAVVSIGASGTENEARVLAKARKALSLVLKQIGLRTADVRYMQERARNQLSVVSGSTPGRAVIHPSDALSYGCE